MHSQLKLKAWSLYKWSGHTTRNSTAGAVRDKICWGMQMQNKMFALANEGQGHGVQFAMIQFDGKYQPL